MNNSLFRFLRHNASAVVLATVLFLLIAAQGAVLYTRGHAVMQSQLRTQLRTSAALSAEFFSGEELDAITDSTSITNPQFEDIVRRLNIIRDDIPNIEYAYLMRKTNDPMALEFIADADSLNTFEQTDINNNGVIEPDEENSYPGDLYDVTDIPAMQSAAFIQPTTDPEITIDQWGQLISGYAPIYREDGTVAAIIGIDMDAADFTALSKRAFSPLLLMLIMILAFGMAAFVGYYIWHRKTQMLSVLDKERSSLLSLTSHQLGAPVVAIKWWLEILREHGQCEGNACENIDHAVNRITNIIQALREAERTEHGTGMKSSRVRVADVVEQAVTSMSDLLAAKNQSVQIHCECHAYVYIDPKLLAGVLSELLQNASVYSKNNTTIDILCSKKGGKIALRIRDRGCGVPAGEEERIFEKMTRGSNAGVWNTDGNGLGLYICKTIIERAGGTIHVEKNAEGGSDFVLNLPISK